MQITKITMTMNNKDNKSTTFFVKKISFYLINRDIFPKLHAADIENVFSRSKRLKSLTSQNSV